MSPRSSPRIQEERGLDTREQRKASQDISATRYMYLILLNLRFKRGLNVHPIHIKLLHVFRLIQAKKRIYYINTNEIPSKLLRENMIFAKYWCARFSIESMFRRQTKCLFNPTSHSSSTSESYKLRNIRVLHNNGIINDESLSAI